MSAMSDQSTQQVQAPSRNQESPADAEPGTASEDLVGNDLANEIQGVLDDAATESEPVQPSAADDPVAEQVLPPSITEIDQLLAKGADEAVAGDFETVQEVLIAEGLLEEGPQCGPPDEAAPSVPYANLPQAAGKQQQDSDPEIGSEAYDAALREQEPPSTADPDLESASTGLNDPADIPTDVRADGADEPADAWGLDGTETPTPGRTRRGALAALLASGPVVGDHLYRACAVVNGPMGRLSPGVRNLVGCVGLIQVFWASVLLIGKLASVLFT